MSPRSCGQTQACNKTNRQTLNKHQDKLSFQTSLAVTAKADGRSASSACLRCASHIEVLDDPHTSSLSDTTRQCRTVMGVGLRRHNFASMPHLRKKPKPLASSTTTSAPFVAAYAAMVFSGEPKTRFHV